MNNYIFLISIGTNLDCKSLLFHNVVKQRFHDIQIYKKYFLYRIKIGDAKVEG